jgi:hypothetical protein
MRPKNQILQMNSLFLRTNAAEHNYTLIQRRTTYY